jgi:hypothetical protein
MHAEATEPTVKAVMELVKGDRPIARFHCVLKSRIIDFIQRRTDRGYGGQTGCRVDVTPHGSRRGAEGSV